jgi:hypothetical protein
MHQARSLGAVVGAQPDCGQAPRSGGEPARGPQEEEGPGCKGIGTVVRRETSNCILKSTRSRRRREEPVEEVLTAVAQYVVSSLKDDLYTELLSHFQL